MNTWVKLTRRVCYDAFGAAGYVCEQLSWWFWEVGMLFEDEPVDNDLAA